MSKVYAMNMPEDPSQAEQPGNTEASPSARFHRRISKQGEARRLRLEIIQGTAHNVTLYAEGRQATVEIDGRKIQLTASVPIELSEGDGLLVAANLGDPFHGVVYLNETTGSGSIHATHKQAGQVITAGAVGALGGAAILLTTALALRGDSHLLGIRLLHVPVYFLSVVVGGAIFVLSCGISVLGLRMRSVSALLRFVAEGR